MTIKQQGGVFGRNPTFNDVDVEGDLTVGGSVTHTGTQNITGQLNVDNVRIDGNTVSTTDTNGDLRFSPNGTGAALTTKTLTGINTRVTNKTINTWGGQGNGVGFENTARYQVSAGNDTVQAFLAAGYNSAGTYPGVGAVGTLTNHPLAIHINNSKVAEFTTSGNLSFNNGLGIDFSATSGTGTSELFDDYEEGTWTPTLTTLGTDFTSVSYATQEGKYTKVGRAVHVSGVIFTSGVTVGSASGDVVIGGLPFTGVSGDSMAGCISDARFWTSNTPLAVEFRGANNYLYLWGRASSVSGTSQTAVADVNTGATGNLIVFSCTYFV